MKNALQFIPLSANVALRGNTSRVCQHAANGRSKVGFSRTEIVATIRQQNKVAEIVHAARFALRANTQRIANVRHDDHEAHVVGYGKLPFSLGETRAFLRLKGYARYRVGQKTFAI